MSAEAIDIYEDSFSEDSFELREKPYNKKEEIEVVKTGGSYPVHQEQPIQSVHQEQPIYPEHQEAGGHSRRNEEEEEVSSEDSDSETESQSSSSTIECLSRDPLFLVLSNFMSTDKGNITHALFKINKSLKKIITLLEKK